MTEALQLAVQSVHQGTGPFGAVIVKGGEVVGRGWNRVTELNDPTAHAETMAIREACKKVADFQLTGCDIYTSCEPCPMCLGAIYWSRPRNVYYMNTRLEAAAIGFDDQHIYDEISKPNEKRERYLQQVIVEDTSLNPYDAWTAKTENIRY